MTTAAEPKRQVHEYRSIIFLCPDCRGDLHTTIKVYAGDPVWVCLSCGREYIYTLAGWGRIPRR